MISKISTQALPVQTKRATAAAPPTEAAPRDRFTSDSAGFLSSVGMIGGFTSGAGLGLCAGARLLMNAAQSSSFSAFSAVSHATNVETVALGVASLVCGGLSAAVLYKAGNVADRAAIFCAQKVGLG